MGHRCETSPSRGRKGHGHKLVGLMTWGLVCKPWAASVVSDYNFSYNFVFSPL